MFSFAWLDRLGYVLTALSGASGIICAAALVWLLSIAGQDARRQEILASLDIAIRVTAPAILGFAILKLTDPALITNFVLVFSLLTQLYTSVFAVIILFSLVGAYAVPFRRPLPFVPFDFLSMILTIPAAHLVWYYIHRGHLVSVELNILSGAMFISFGAIFVATIRKHIVPSARSPSRAGAFETSRTDRDFVPNAERDVAPKPPDGRVQETASESPEAAESPYPDEPWKKPRIRVKAVHAPVKPAKENQEPAPSEAHRAQPTTSPPPAGRAASEHPFMDNLGKLVGAIVEPIPKKANTSQVAEPQPKPNQAFADSGPAKGMQLRMKRGERQGRFGKLIFTLDARIDISAENKRLIEKYSLGGRLIYESANREKYRQKAMDRLDDSNHHASMFAPAEQQMKGTAKSFWRLGQAAVNMTIAALSLKITVNSLMQGVHVECKDMDELLEAEEAIETAAHNLKAELAVATTFTGEERAIEL